MISKVFSQNTLLALKKEKQAEKRDKQATE
jgi:hypothetical protein